MVISDLFRGTALNAIDQKGRVSVPADFRAVIQTRHRRAVAEDGFDPAGADPDARHAAAGKVVVVVKDRRRPCLVAYEASYLRAHRDTIVARHADKSGLEREEAIKRDLRDFARTEDLAWDVNGRIMLNTRLCEKIGVDAKAGNGVDNKVAFYALGETFEIWNPAKLAEWLDAEGEDEDAGDVRALLAEKAK